MAIREATLPDVPELVAMGRRFRDSTSYAATLPENPEQMAATVTAMIESEASVVLVCEQGDGVLAGMLGLARFTHPMSGEPTVGEVFWWSERPGIGCRLLAAGKEWARSAGAVKMQMIQPAAEDRLAAVYERLGFTRIEVAWQLDLEAA